MSPMIATRTSKLTDKQKAVVTGAAIVARIAVRFLVVWLVMIALGNVHNDIHGAFPAPGFLSLIIPVTLLSYAYSWVSSLREFNSEISKAIRGK